MKSIIQQLQIDSTNPDISISTLLAKAKIVASKLNLSEFLHWINQEINGYSEKVPEYRVVAVEVKAFNPFHGWQPVKFSDVKTQTMISSRAISQPISGIEAAVISGNSSLEIQLNPEAYIAISKAIEFQGQITSFTSPNIVKSILEAVRNRVLEICLALEDEGILGEGISFSDEEKKVAETLQKENKIHIENIQNFSGNIGDVSGAAIINSYQNIYSEASTKELLELIDEQKDKIKIEEGERAKLEKAVLEIKEQVAKKLPDHAVVKKNFLSISAILEQASGSILAQMIISGISKIVS
jgi:hypothetical protein